MVLTGSSARRDQPMLFILSRKDDEAMVGDVVGYARLCAVQNSAFDVGGELYTAAVARVEWVYLRDEIRVLCCLSVQPRVL